MAKRKKNRGKRPPWTPFEECDAAHWEKQYVERLGARIAPAAMGRGAHHTVVLLAKRYLLALAVDLGG